MEILLALIVGLSLAAASGLRVFIPLLALSTAAHLHLLHLPPQLHWIASPYAIAGFALAAALEIAAYYIPWLDHLLDTLTTPLATGAGALLAASQLHAPLLHALDSSSTPAHSASILSAAIAALAGAAIAGSVQLSTVTLRAGSTASTAGLANPILASLENALASILSVLAVAVPILLAILLLAAVALLIARHRRRARSRAGPPRLPWTATLTSPQSTPTPR